MSVVLNETVKHYDMDVDFFQGFLDPYMKYTSGLFESGSEDLAVGTRRMLDTIINMGALNAGKKVLEVGPGWGSLLKRVKERNIAIDYTGVSPSAVQNAYISTFKDESDTLVTTTFESLDYKGPKFDVIVLIGSFCHLQNKHDQLQTMCELLADDGCILIEDTFFISDEDYKKHVKNSATRFVQESVFGFAEILSLSEQLQQIKQAGLSVSSMLEHSDSYKATIDCWIKNLKKMDQNKFPNSRNFVKYMSIAQRGWSHTIHNQLMVLKKAP